MNRRLAFCVLVTTLLPSLWHTSVVGAELPTFRYCKPLLFPEFKSEEIVSAPLDSDIYGATTNGFSDLRILDAQGNSVAFIIRRSATMHPGKERRIDTVLKPSVRPIADGALEITFDIDPLKHPQPPDGFTLVTPLHNFERRVEISRATAEGAWIPVVSDGMVFDYSQFIDVSNADLAIDSTVENRSDTHRYRMVIADVTQEQQSQLMEFTRTLQGTDETSRVEQVAVNRQPFRIDSIQFWHNIETPTARLIDAPVTEFRIEQDAFAKTTRLLFDSRRDPIAELQVAVKNRNFNRSASVEVQGLSSPEASTVKWLPAIATDTLSRYDVRSLTREDVNIVIPETRSQHYRLVIDNRDSPPLEILGVSARCHVYEAVFFAQAGQNYSFVYGDDFAKLPVYDTAALAAALARNVTPIIAVLGEQSLSNVAPDSRRTLERLLNNPKFLATMIAIVMILLGVGLYRANGRLKLLPRDDT